MNAYREKMTSIDAQVKLMVFVQICWVISKLGTVDAPREEMFPIDFQVMWSKVRIKLLIFILLIILWSFAWRL